MSKKQSYLFTAEWWKSIRVMDIQERGIAITAICEFVFEGKVQEYELPEYKKQTLNEILSELDKQLERASELSRKRAKAGSIGLANRLKKSSNNASFNQDKQDDITNDSNCQANDSNCYPSRARFHHQQQNNYLEDIDNKDEIEI